MIRIKQSFLHLLKSIKSVFTNLVDLIRDVALVDFIRDVAYGIKCDLLEAALQPKFISAFISIFMKFMLLIYFVFLLTIAMAFVLFVIVIIVCLLVNLWYVFVPIVCFVALIAIAVGVIRLIYHDEIVKNKVVIDEARDDEDLNSSDDSSDDTFDDRNDDKANDDNEFKEGKK